MSSGDQNQKGPKARPQALLVRAGPSPALEKFQAVLGKLADMEVVEGESWSPGSATVFLDAKLASTDPSASAILLQGEESVSWSGSRLHLPSLSMSDLARVLQLALGPERKPGLTCLTENQAEIFYEKVHHAAEVGSKVDHFLGLLEKKENLLPQLFHLRQLSYAVFHQAFLVAPPSLVPTLDFQISAGESRIVFAARFSAPEGILPSWKESWGNDPHWKAATQSADLLAITELHTLGQIEIKALITTTGTKEASLLFASIEDFLPEASEQEARKAAKLAPLGSKAPVPEEAGDSGQAKAEGDQPVAMGLNYKVRSEMLENENANLQGLVKKKNHLLTELNRDVNRAQRELVLAKNTQNKELHKLRMELEKEKNESRKFQEELARVRRRQEEEKAGAAPAGGEQNSAPARDWEKEFKAADYAKRLAEEKVAELTKKSALQEEAIQSLRKEATASSGEINDLKDKAFRLSQMVNAKKAQVAQNAGAQTASAAQIALAEKLKEAQRQQLQAKSKEQELEIEIKRLKLQLDAAEKNLKAKVAVLEKAIESKDKQLEEAKRQKADALKKAEEGKKAR